MSTVLPVIDGVSASSLFVPKDVPEHMTLCAYLNQRFGHIAATQWQQRFNAQQVFNRQGFVLDKEVLVKQVSGQKIFYYRFVENEPVIPFDADILYEDENVVVADKPHFLPVIPAGQYVQQTLLVRLRQQLQCDELTAVHRIDRETAGLVLLVKKASLRHVYQDLFRTCEVHKQYEAIAPWRPEYSYPFCHQSRLQEGDTFFCMQETDGPVNAITHIDVIEMQGQWARYALQPITGKRHQLRVHLNALGMPIAYDGFYPKAKAINSDDDSRPLQLLAKQLSFVDPMSGKQHQWQSALSLLPLSHFTNTQQSLDELMPNK